MRKAAKRWIHWPTTHSKTLKTPIHLLPLSIDLFDFSATSLFWFYLLIVKSCFFFLFFFWVLFASFTLWVSFLFVFFSRPRSITDPSYIICVGCSEFLVFDWFGEYPLRDLCRRFFSFDCCLTFWLIWRWPSSRFEWILLNLRKSISRFGVWNCCQRFYFLSLFCVYAWCYYSFFLSFFLVLEIIIHLFVFLGVIDWLSFLFPLFFPHPF